VRQHLEEYVSAYQEHFLVHRRDNTSTAQQYLEGLIACEKGHANMERMEEAVEGSQYRSYQQFVSNSPWVHAPVIGQVSQTASQLFAMQQAQDELPTGLLIDESAHLKKGRASVGVSRQYAGVVGKVENCQVGVYVSLCHGTYATIINERLFLPECWTEDSERCVRAGIPEDQRTHHSKPQLALAMIDEHLAQGIRWDWIGGDGLDGHSDELLKGLEERHLFYVLDVHKDERVYLDEPHIAVPPRSHVRGATPTRRQADREPLRLDQYWETLPDDAWEEVTVRKTTKGWLRLDVHLATVWMWDGEEMHARQRTLVITKTVSRQPKIKYSLSNGEREAYTPQEYAYFQAQRYWVERCFDDAKNDLGMSDYQVRKWLGWHHHHALVLMACLFIMQERGQHREAAPLLSVRDARLLIITRLWGTEADVEKQLQFIEKRHWKRKRAIAQHYTIYDDVSWGKNPVR
jgi:SRSO17 transposase